METVTVGPSSNGTTNVTGEARRILLDLGAENPDAVAAEQLGKVQLYRREGGTWEWLDDFEDPALFTLEAVRARYGGGDYQARLLRPGGTYLGRPSFRIAGAPIAKPAGAPPAAAPDAVLERILERLERLEHQPAPRAQQQESPALEMVKLMVPLMTAMSTASATAMAPLLEALAKRDRPALDPLEMFKQFRELMAEEGGRGGYDDVIRGVGLPLLSRLTELARTEAPAAPGATVPHPAPPLPVSTLPPWAQLIQPHVDGLLTLATVRADPAYPVEQIMQQATDEELSFIGDFLDRGDAARDEFYATFPAAMKHRSWFDRFFAALEQELPEDDGEEEAAHDGAARNG